VVDVPEFLLVAVFKLNWVVSHRSGFLYSAINHGTNLRLPLDTQNAERPSASGGFAPLTPTGGSASWLDGGSAPIPPLAM